MQSKRNENSKKVFNDYVNKLVEIYRETNEFKGGTLAEQMRCTSISQKRFNAMNLGGVDRLLTPEETERIYSYIKYKTEVPCFCTQEEEETREHQDVAAMMGLKKFEEEPEKKEDVIECKESEKICDTNEECDNKTTSCHGILHYVLHGVRNKLREIFHKKRCNNTLIRYKKYQDGSEVFAWVDNNENIDYILKINGYRIERCGRVTEEEAKLGSELGQVDVRRMFHAFTLLKRHVYKLEMSIEQKEAKMDAIAQILLMDEKKP